MINMKFTYMQKMKTTDRSENIHNDIAKINDFLRERLLDQGDGEKERLPCFGMMISVLKFLMMTTVWRTNLRQLSLPFVSAPPWIFPNWGRNKSYFNFIPNINLNIEYSKSRTLNTSVWIDKLLHTFRGYCL